MDRALLACSLLLAAWPAASAVNAPAVPPPLQPSAAEAPAFMLRAEGVHVFECRPNAHGGYQWVFTNPDVSLSDGTTERAIEVSPNTFEASTDRSTVSGRVRAVAGAGADNLPWMLLTARSTPDDGLFAGVTSVQRVNTSGGVAPRDGCGEYTVGTETRAAFSADYYFYRRRG
jgi:hypothetical protein